MLHLMMRATRKRKLDDLFDDVTDDIVDTTIKSKSLLAGVAESESGNGKRRAKKTKWDEKNGPAKSGINKDSKLDPKKSKVRRKIIPQLSGQRTLSGFFK